MNRPSNADKPSFELLLQEARSLPWTMDNEISTAGQDFLSQVHDALDPASFEDFRLDDIAVWAKSLWDWGNVRRGDQPKIRVRTAPDKAGELQSLTLLEVVGPDMPFLVNSVVGACRAVNASPLLVIHPLIHIDRNDEGLRIQTDTHRLESYIQVVLGFLDETASDRLNEEVERSLDDVRLCVKDFSRMQATMRHAAIDVASSPHLSPEDAKESAAFLNWLANDHFTFLGCRHYTFQRSYDGNLLPVEPEILPNTSFGILRDEERYILTKGDEPSVVTDQISDFLTDPDPIIISKSSFTSRVHRRVRADYIGVKQFDDTGHIVGEVRFAGLFTAEAYNRMTQEIPLIRRKAESVVTASGKQKNSHDGNALRHILETYPRDELFQIDEEELLEFVLDILQLQTRTETRLFVRYDRFERFVSAMVYVPKEAFNSDLRSRIGHRLSAAFGGELLAFYPTVDDSPLARIRFIIASDADLLRPNIGLLEDEIIKLANSWNDQMRALVRAERSNIAPQFDESALTSAFNAAYKEAFEPEDALKDIHCFSELSDERPVSLRAFRHSGDEKSELRANLYSFGRQVLLSNSVPVFEEMGLFVRSETGYPIKLGQNGFTCWMHHLVMRTDDGSDIDLDAIKIHFEQAFEGIWLKKTENDGFNQLVLKLGTGWREAALFRALCRYRTQTGLDPAEATQIEALTSHTNITALLFRHFQTRFDPNLELSIQEREEVGEELREQINLALEDVASLDQDRVLRRIGNLIYAIKRTNFYQLDEQGEPVEHIAFKIASRELDLIPNPKPYREIFIWSPLVEGVHLRFGPVARGGLRWSDRKDDFRTEVLGLVKAQQVKNAVIVPVGSKGCFYPKKLPADGTREEVRDAAIKAYQTFILAMLQLTDNVIEGQTKPPKNTIVWDEADPYLVVAADKGTATFSDIANEISTSLGFWLGDAFASGGSAGYDHKKMGITARGAWVAVQRHFRELGINTQTDPFSVIGVGDMSGDVFGNGMLLSKTIQLKAAFNHLHIFIDPNPMDAEKNWKERQRLFNLPRSGWDDYDQSLISKGGGVFSRSAKRIPLTSEVRNFLKTDAKALTPVEFINAILKAEADLLWFGGIGTYVKASTESHLDVGDKTNDVLRVDADDLRVRVIGEGANLGLTQAARIEYGRSGGAVNSDAIDNSAGVDSSDHEVNIKILLKNAIDHGSLEEDDRNALLASMTDDVSALVLKHNYDQTGALSVASASKTADLDSHERLMERLENDGILKRSVEGLPKSDEIRKLKENQDGLTRPELAVLLAYAKITLFDEIVESAIPDDPYLQSRLIEYFPNAVRHFDTALDGHRLKREIISTIIANEVVNLGGITFVHRVRERASVETSTVVLAFIAAVEVFRLNTLLDRIDTLDNEVPAKAQTALRLDLISTLRRQVFHLAQNWTQIDSLADLINRYRTDIQDVFELGAAGLSPFEHDLMEKRLKRYVETGAPGDVAKDVALQTALLSATDIVDLAHKKNVDSKSMALLFNAVGAGFQFERLKDLAISISPEEHWDRLAVRGLIESFINQQINLAELVFDRCNGNNIESFEFACEQVSKFQQEIAKSYERFRILLAEIEKAGPWTFAKLVLVSNALQGVIDDIKAGTT